MSRWLGVVGVIALLAGCGANPEAAARMEADEDFEETVGNEAAVIGDNPDDMDTWDTDGGQIEAEMESEPYPE